MWTGSDGWQPHRERRVEVTPAGVDVALGAVVIVAAALAAGLVPVSSTGPRLGLMAAALSLFAAATVDLRAVVVVTITAYLVFDGFLVNQLGELSWRGAADTRRLAVLCLAAALGLVAGLGYRAAHRVRTWRTWAEQLARQVTVTPIRRTDPFSRNPAAIWSAEEARHG
jgi:hypothetical protein